MDKVGYAVVGCGYIADSYRYCLRHHSDKMQLLGVFDRDLERAAAYKNYWGDRVYASYREMLEDPAVEIIVNLTTPESHAELTREAIAAGKHVYSEKPLGVAYAEAAELREQARRAGRRLAAAPCNLLGESAQTLWKAVRDGRVGQPRLAYAELDDGMIHRANYRDWVSRSGRAWPARNEFMTGCTFEHSGYALTLLCAMFGPVRRVTSFASLLIADKRTEPPLPDPAPDFSVGLLEFDDGVVARLTNSIVAPYDHRFRVIGEEGALEIGEIWDYASAVRQRPLAEGRVMRVLQRRLGALLPGRKVPLARKRQFVGGSGRPMMDFMRGVRELADAIRDDRPCRLDADFAVHITEVTEKLQYPERFASPAPVLSGFAPIDPMEWAK